jgi:hypothetical protein
MKRKNGVANDGKWLLYKATQHLNNCSDTYWFAGMFIAGTGQRCRVWFIIKAQKSEKQTFRLPAGFKFEYSGGKT